MKHFICHLSAMAVLAFTLSFVTGMSVSLMYQEHQALKPFIAAQALVEESAAMLPLSTAEAAIAMHP